ncbi:hypothetical protein ACF1BE_10100 [Streptomyces sp. NPDC014991]|uniref:hypothetical protein n=1 Tax=Streptomyces sp. NPDC014991 TaxID=3364935 RepID=UPI0036F6ABEB
MNLTKKWLTTLAVPATATMLLTGLSAPQASAATLKADATCSASLTPTADAKIKVRTYYTKKTSTTWKHLNRYFYPSSHGIKKSRSDTDMTSWLLVGNSRIDWDHEKPGSIRWDMITFSYGYPQGANPVTKKGKTRLVTHGWYALDTWPTECKAQSWVF